MKANARPKYPKYNSSVSPKKTFITEREREREGERVGERKRERKKERNIYLNPEKGEINTI